MTDSQQWKKIVSNNTLTFRFVTLPMIFYGKLQFHARWTNKNGQNYPELPCLHRLPQLTLLHIPLSLLPLPQGCLYKITPFSNADANENCVTIVRHSILFLACSLASLTSILLSFRALFTPSIQPNLGLPLALFPSTFTFITFFSCRSLSILSTWLNHLKTFISTLAANSLLTPILALTTSFLTLSNWGTPVILLRHFISNTFSFCLSVTFMPHNSEPYVTVGTTTFLLKRWY